ncbi:hypothetical protein [Orf virus]|uniref:Uncharacterized protein n=1 Tax=Orf virus TaxID=10258 RepID=A0A3G2M283_ORFV|nr:hypothetical protein [Orf virus]QLI57754.1 hypothetical protein [Orf virus]
MACFLELLDSIFNRRHRNFRPEDMYRPSDAPPPKSHTPRTPRTPRTQCPGHPRRQISSPIYGAHVDSLPRNRKRFRHQHSCPADYERCQLPDTISLEATLLTVTMTSISSISSSSSSDSSSLGQCRLSMVSAASTSTTFSSSE